MAAVAEITAIHPPATVQQTWLALALGLVTKLFFSRFLLSFCAGLKGSEEVECSKLAAQGGRNAR